MKEPKGWQLVPDDPTEEMIEESRAYLAVGSRNSGPDVWKAMKEVAPSYKGTVIPLVEEVYEALGEKQARTSPENVKDVLHALISAELRLAPHDGKLTVWYGSIPESNGKHNYTAILHRGDISKGITIERNEYPDRVRYEADRVRWMIGELDKEPFILDYDADKHSGYEGPKTDLNGAIQRVAEFVTTWRTRRGLDPEVIHGLDSDKELRVDDLIQLVRAARIAQGD
jgi:hypothetical protein